MGSTGVPPVGFGVLAETIFATAVQQGAPAREKFAAAGTPPPTGGTPVLPGNSACAPIEK
jgi:hypothetical protein